MAMRTLKVPASCPSGQLEHERCGKCLREQLGGVTGVRKIDLEAPIDGQAQATLVLDYDPRLVTLTELDAEVKRAGICMSPGRAQMVLGIEGMVSPRSEQAIEAALARMPGVAASASFASKSLRVEFDRTQCALPEIVRRLDDLGFRLRDGKPVVEAAPARHRMEGLINWGRRNHKLVMAIAGGVLLLAGFLVHVLGGERLGWLRIALIAPAYVLCGWYTFKDTLVTLWNRQFDIDVLMFAAAVGAAILGHYEEGGLLLFLFALGGAGEEMAMDKARRAIESLAKLAPDTATLRDAEGNERLVRVEDLKPGEQVVVKPFDRIPADGTVSSGNSSVDQSPITGESVPVSKQPGESVFAGTINGDGLLVVNVARLASESTLAKIVRMVQEAQTQKSPTQVFTDKVERYYVPIVLIATAGLIILPPLFLGGWSVWFLRSMAFLTAASPCALAIGTPATVLSGIARAARGGVLVKGGVHLENLGRVNAIALDKTGTLTRGRPEVTDIVPLNGQSEMELLAMAAAVESASTHPLAQAIVGHARSHECIIAPVSDVEQVPGRGMRARLNGSIIGVGHVDLMSSSDPTLSRVRETIADLAGKGRTTVVVSVNGSAVAVLGLADRLRDNAAATLVKLKELGIQKIVMLTGDSIGVAQAIARDAGVDAHHAALLPGDKVRILKELQQSTGPVAMVGDGVNDAPALATATVGVAMGGAGTDVAIEAADVVLMADDLAKLPDAIGLSRFCRRIIQQNLLIALGVIALLAPMAALGIAPLGVAVLFHEGSTVVVVLNAMRLLVYRGAGPSVARPGKFR